MRYRFLHNKAQLWRRPITDFPAQLPHGDLQEVLPDVFFVTGESRPNFGGKSVQFSRNMTVIRDGTALTLVNTMRLDKTGLAQLEQLGTVAHLVKLGSFHGRDDAFYRDRYNVPLWAPAGMPHERGVKTDHELRPGAPGPISDASVFNFETASKPEAILHIHRSDGILVSCDSLQNWTGPDEYFDADSAATMEAAGFFHLANIGPGWRNAAQPEARDFAALKALDFRHLLSAHGAPLLNTAHAAVSATLKEQFGV